MAIRKSSNSGTPFGNTANRPSSPQVGQTYYNGTLGYLEIYTDAGWIPATGANDFSLNLTGTHTEVTFSQSYSSGSYSIVSLLNDTTLDIYALATDGSAAGYTNTKAFTATQRFNKMVVIGGSAGDVLQFSYKTTYETTTSTTSTAAGPYITEITPSGMPNQNDTVTITGGNFATDVAVTFTGTEYSSTSAKLIVRSSSTQLIVTRPDNFPPSGAPYTVTVTNPSVANQPTSSAAHIYSGITAGVVPVWQTTSITSPYISYNTAYSTTISATDADGGSSITYSLISGSLPTGITLNSSTGVISGTCTLATGASYPITVRATDSGGNTANQSFTLYYQPINGGTLTADATYYYRTFTTNSNLISNGTFTADVLAVGGGGASCGYAGGGGGGEVILISSKSITNGTYPFSIGGGGTGTANQAFNSAMHGTQTTCFGETVKPGGGAKSSDDSSPTTSVTDRGPLSTVGNGGGGSSRSAGYGGTAGSSVGSGITRYSGYYGGNTTGGGSSPHNNNNYTGGGGGGAGGNGQNGQNANRNGDGNYGGGDGGSGVSLFGYFWGGGGGGGIYYQNSSPYRGGNGGSGGGGGAGSNNIGTGATGYNNGQDGSTNGNGGNGGINTGGGGGAGRGEVNAIGGNGGSGIVMLRYTRASVGG